MMWLWISEMFTCFAIVLGLGVHCIIASIKESNRAH